MAGDYTKQKYLASMEGAVFSGKLCTEVSRLHIFTVGYTEVMSLRSSGFEAVNLWQNSQQCCMVSGTHIT